MCLPCVCVIAVSYIYNEVEMQILLWCHCENPARCRRSVVCVRLLSGFCTGWGWGGGWQEAQSFIKSQHHHMAGVLGVPLPTHTHTLWVWEFCLRGGLSESVLNVTESCKEVFFFSSSSLSYSAASLRVCAYMSYFRRCVTPNPPHSPRRTKTQARLVETKAHPLSFCPHPGSNLSTQ